ncbi:MAG: glycerol-3-phosphate acyltransferase [Caldilineales bacterium]|nr:glycerol-3-phosphate acyltransferase [Caldilineales bacterium]
MLILLFLIAYVCGSLPFSVWIGRIALRADICDYGDHNPGATNVVRAGGKFWGAIALLLDYLKGAIPVGISHFVLDIEGWSLAFVALAPVLGHAFSPFLRFRGGKAVAATFGIWTGLTVYEGPIVLGIGLGLGFLFLAIDGWAVVTGMVGLLAFFLITPTSSNILGVRPDLYPMLLAAWVGNAAILFWKQRRDLRLRPKLRPWLFDGRGNA